MTRGKESEPGPLVRPRIESIDVVVVTFNSEAVISDCLDAVQQQQGQSARVGVIVVDNTSSDGTLNLVASHAIGARVIRSGGNYGYSAAINLGIASSLADAVLILNPDTQMRPGSLDALRQALEQTDAGLAAPQIINNAGERELTIRRFPSASRLLGQSVLGAQRAGRWPMMSDFVIGEDEYQQRGPHDWCSGAVLLVTRTCLEAVGEWDEAFFLYSEETDYCWRAKKRGFETVYEPAAIVEHIGGDSGTSARLWSILVQNRVAVVRRHRGSLHGAAYWLVTLVSEGVRSVRPRNRRAATDLLFGRQDPAVVTAQERARSQGLRY